MPFTLSNLLSRRTAITLRSLLGNAILLGCAAGLIHYSVSCNDAHDLSERLDKTIHESIARQAAAGVLEPHDYPPGVKIERFPVGTVPPGQRATRAALMKRLENGAVSGKPNKLVP
jgi:hypothetical protein